MVLGPFINVLGLVFTVLLFFCGRSDFAGVTFVSVFCN